MAKKLDINGKNVLHFIQEIIEKENNIDNIINLVKDDETKDYTFKLDEGNNDDVEDKKKRPIRGFIYERLWDLCIKFGVVDELTKKPNDKKLMTSHIFGNPNSKDVIFNEDCWKGEFYKFLEEPIISGSSGGYSDITFINKLENEKEELIFVSVKYFKDGHRIADYDIGKLCTLVEKHKKENRDIKIMIFVKDKKKVKEKLKDQRKSSDIMIKYIDPGDNRKYENIYDKNYLKMYYYKLRILLEQYNFLKSDDDKKEFEEYLGILKSPFIPRFHQELFVKKINELLHIKKEKNILVGAIPRSGKSYIMAGAILDFVKKFPSKKSNFLIITPAPTETYPEYEAIFDNYIDFEKLNIKCVNLGRKGQKISRDSNNVIIVSKQKLGWNESNKSQNEVVSLENVSKAFDLKPGIKLELIFLDEAHFGMSTESAQNILDEIKRLCGSTPKIFVTATYKKPLDTYDINREEAKLTWDINDINIMKKLDTIADKENEIKKRFGRIYEDTIKNYNVSDLKKMYETYPSPYLITSVWDYKYIVQEKKKIGDTEYGFDMEKLFTINKDSSNKYTNEFHNKQSVINILRYYFGIPNTKDDYSVQHMTRHRGILPRIKRICENRCRTQQTKNKPTTQLWFLPYGQQRPVKNVVTALMNILSNNEFKDINNEYYFFVALDETEGTTTRFDNVKYYSKSKISIKDQILAVEKSIKEGEIDGKSITHNNLIILAGARLHLGISLKNVDIVTLWNNISSSDAVFQMLFRSMTEVDGQNCVKGEYCDNKKFGFMVDLNPQRALTNVFLFKENLLNKENGESENQHGVIGDLITIDEDVFQDKYGGDETKKQEYIKDLLNKLYDSWGASIDSMKKLTQKTIRYDQDVLSKISVQLQGISLSKENKTINVIVPKPEGFDAGQKVDKRGKTKTKKKDKIISLSELASEVMVEYLSLLNIFTFYNEENGDKCFISGDIIESDKFEYTRVRLHQLVFDSVNKDTFMSILNSRLGRSKNPVSIEVLNSLITSIKSNDNKLSINKLMKTQKKKYYSYTIDNPEALLEYINQNLTPKENERKKLGEIFTPMWLVDEILDKLPKEVWTKKDYTWLDPAVGIGNFPVAIYMKLMKGLESVFPDEEKRRKHILEKMLYMIDISDKNIFILKKILCGDKYNLNIHKGSFLKRDCNYTFKFDIILGNPPYNPPKTDTGSSGNSIWPHFVIKSFYMVNDKGFLLFIHPPGWKKPTNDIFNPEKLDILNGEYYRIDKKTKKPTGYKQIRQGLVWQLLKDNGNFSFIYTNTNDTKNIGDKLFIPFFPAVDYYVYQKKSPRNGCDTKNIFLDEVKESKSVRINYELNYLPNLITNQTQDILYKVTNKEGEKPEFKAGFDPRGFETKEKGGSIKYLYDATSKGPNYTNYGEEIPNVNISKIVLNENGGIKGFYCKYIDKLEKIGVLHHTLLYEIDKIKGKNIQKFFNSDLVKFIFLITQYTSGKMQTNEKLVANSITIPPIDVDDYYKFFGIEEHRKYIENTLSNFKRISKENKSNKTKKNNSPHKNKSPPKKSNKTKKNNSPPKNNKPKSKKKKIIKKSKSSKSLSSSNK
jgi:hypothetical protein